MSDYTVSPQAAQDLIEIWTYIAGDNENAADRVESALYRIFAILAREPGLGHRRQDLTDQPVFFFPVYSYLIIYAKHAEGVRIVSIPHGARDVKDILNERNP